MTIDKVRQFSTCSAFLRSLLVWTLIGAVGVVLGACDSQNGEEEMPQKPPLERYVDAPTPAYSWEEVGTTSIRGGECAELRLTSQRWRDIRWRHRLFVVRPSAPSFADHGVLLIGGGDQDDLSEGGRSEQCQLLALAARVSGQTVAMLEQVPNQPLFDGRREDELIAYTFDQFLDSPSEETWPLLLPMTKSAVKAMDAVEEYSAENYSNKVDRFTVTGASKRGWTTWLTAAIDDRVAALAPMVFDILKMGPQLDHQLEAWGDYSSRIADYSERGFPEVVDTPEGETLLDIVDPYRYRDRISQPKLVVLGTNDAFWPIDALNLYWDDLQGEKHVLYLPNEGHGVSDAANVLRTVGAFARRAASGVQFPALDWTYSTGEEGVTLTVTSSRDPDAVRLWQAHSSSRDFRDAEFDTTSIDSQDDGEHEINVPRPDQGYRAVLGEAVYEVQGQTITLSTQVRILASEEANANLYP